jgi:hypothetical protein
MLVMLDETVNLPGRLVRSDQQPLDKRQRGPEGHKSIQSFELEGSIPDWYIGNFKVLR